MSAGTSHTARLYALIVSGLLFFVVWAVVAAHPWQRAAADPRLVALTRREQRLRFDATRVRKIVTRRYADYRIQLTRRRIQIAAAHRRQAQLNAAAKRREAQLAAAAALLVAQQQAAAASTQTVYPTPPATAAPAAAASSALAQTPSPPPAAAPPVRVVTLPPLVVTRTS